MEEYVDYDLTGQAPELAPATCYSAMADDTTDLNRGVDLIPALEQLAVPTAFLRAPRGLMDEPAALYTPDYVRSWAGRLPALKVQDVDDVNHYTIVMEPRGAGAVAAAVLPALAAARANAPADGAR